MNISSIVNGVSTSPNSSIQFTSILVRFKKKLDKVMILKVIERKNKDNINYLDIDIKLSTKKLNYYILSIV